MKQRLPIIHLAILLFLALGAGAMYYQTEKKILSNNTLQKEVDQQAENVARLNELATSLPALSSETARYLRALPADESEVANFASTVEQKAREAGLLITFHFDDFPKNVSVSGQNILGLGTDIILEGTFQGLTVFLSRLSSLPYFFKVDKMTILQHETKTGIKASIDGSLMMSTVN